MATTEAGVYEFFSKREGLCTHSLASVSVVLL